ncbi:MAG: hypothetical protein AAFO03_14325 [Bacteroidota bacterium]
MKHHIFLILLLASLGTAYTQTQIVLSNGEVQVSGNTQIVLHNTQWINNATFTPGQSTVVMSGDATDAQSAISGTTATTFYNLEMNKSANGAQLQQNVQVDNELIMTSGNLNLNGDTCTLGTANGTLVNETEDSRVTGTTGGILRKTLDISAPNSENPGNIGIVFTSDQDFGSTLVERGHVAQSINGAESVQRYFQIAPTNNAALNTTVQLYYFDAELNDLEESELGAWRRDSAFWYNPTSTDSDEDANYVETANIDFFSTFTLANRAPQLQVRVLLQGPYDDGTANMNDDLRTSNLIPTTEPYAALGYDHPASGGSEKIAPAVLSTTGSDAIVDWVFVELRDAANTNNVLATRSALLQKDGDIVDLDGKSNLSFPDVLLTETPLIAIRHRNHLGIIATNASNLMDIPVMLDFSTNPALATGGTAAFSDLGNGQYALFSGDFDGNGQVQNTDSNAQTATLGASGYLPGDSDLNGQVQNTDLQIKLTPNLGRGAQFSY